MTSVQTSLLARAFVLAALLLAAGIVGAWAQTPFQPPPPAKPKIVRLLAYPEYFDRRVLEAFARATGWEVGYDAYTLQLEVPDKWKEGPYDIVVLPGPALERRIAAGELAKLDKARLPHARDVQPAVLAKLEAYDPTGAYAVPYGWSPYGLLYDARRVPPRLGGAPASWSVLIDPRYPKDLGCGAAIPNARDAMFVAAWRLMGADPFRINGRELEFAAAMLARAKPALEGFAVADPVGALARGAACLSAGTPGEAAAANKRARLMGRPQSIAFAYAREGGGVSIDAFAIPRDAPHRDVAYELVDFLLDAENAEADARVAGVFSSRDGGEIEALKKLSPLGAWNDRFSAALDKEWTHLRAAK